MEEQVNFESDGLKLSGVLHIPDDLPPEENRPTMLILHGFGSNKESQNCIWPAKQLTDWGYVTLRFDMRSCGESEGEKNHIICLDQVEDTKNAITYLQTRPEVDPKRIGLILNWPSSATLRGPSLRSGSSVPYAASGKRWDRLTRLFKVTSRASPRVWASPSIRRLSHF